MAKPRVVIPRDRLPLGSPLVPSIALYLLGVHIDAGWFWGVLGCVWCLVAITWTVDSWTRVERDPFEEGRS